jgi:hypothetical protein
MSRLAIIVTLMAAPAMAQQPSDYFNAFMAQQRQEAQQRRDMLEQRSQQMMTPFPQTRLPNTNYNQCRVVQVCNMAGLCQLQQVCG